MAAEHEPRIKGCVSYCGVSDVEARVAQAIPILDRAIPGYRDFIRFSSPKTHVEKLKDRPRMNRNQGTEIRP